MMTDTFLIYEYIDNMNDVIRCFLVDDTSKAFGELVFTNDSEGELCAELACNEAADGPDLLEWTLIDYQEILKDYGTMFMNGHLIQVMENCKMGDNDE